MRAFLALAFCVSLTHNSFGQQEQRIQRYLSTGDYTRAETALRDTLAAQSGESAIKLRLALADLLREEGSDAEARQLFRQALQSPGLTPGQRISALMGLAGIDGQNLATETSNREWTEALALARQENDRIAEANGLRGLAIAWLQAGEFSRAEPLLRRSLRILENAPAAKPWELASTLTVIGESQLAQGKQFLAEAVWLRALDLNRNAFGEAHPQVAFLLGHLAGLYSERRQFDLARRYASESVRVMAAACGEDSLAVAAALATQASVEQRAGQLRQSAGIYENALRIMRSHPGNASVRIRILQNYAGLLKAIHRDREARALFSEARAFRQRMPG